MEDTKLRKALINFWSLAVQDKFQRPSCRVEDGYFVMVITGNRDQWTEMVKTAGVPSHAEQNVEGETLICKWLSHADTVFGEGGLIAQTLSNYEVRLPQLHMARMVQRSIEMKQPAVIEAGTGTGKSYAYAAIAMSMGKKIVISTSNKALQMQLYKKDIPFLQTLFVGKKVALIQGKGNYACRNKVEDLGSGTYSIDGDLLDWYVNTNTGNTEEIPFATDPIELKAMTVDLYCGGKHCAFYDRCFYYASKLERAEADVLICNHMLLALHELYPSAAIIPAVDVIVVDEAHQYASYVRNAVGIDLGLSTVDKRIRLAQDTGYVEAIEQSRHDFFGILKERVGDKADREIAIERDDAILSGKLLSDDMMKAADEIWPEGQIPESTEERKRQTDANQLRNTADAIRVFSEQTRPGYVRWLDNGDNMSLRHVPHDVSQYIARMAGFIEKTPSAMRDYTLCTRCGRKLSSELVAVLEGKPYGPDCIRHVDVMGDAEHLSLTDWLNQEPPEPTVTHIAPTPVIFTSATLAAPDMKSFMRECGLPYALEMVASSPFDYMSNALLYVPAAATSPAPTKGTEYRDWLVLEMERLVHASGGGAFLLFTSYDAMRYVSQRLRWTFEQQKYAVFIQGTLPKLEIVKRFVEAGNGVLFATKSFWEGVSIDGQALRLVAIDKMPFEAPSPLNQAQEAALTQWARTQGMTDKEAEWFPFENLRVPRMVIDLKQGAGRLIRTATDTGVIAILDNRLRSAQYARRIVLPSLPPAKLTSQIFEVDAFFRDRKALASMRLADMAPIQQLASIADLDEVPF